MPSPANGLGHLVRGSVGVGGDVLEEHLRELASGVVRHVSVQAVAVGLGHLLQFRTCCFVQATQRYFLISTIGQNRTFRLWHAVLQFF